MNGEYLPVIRSGELFSFFNGEEQDSYFDMVAGASGDSVRPEAMFGTNGWQRRLSLTGANPEQATREFRAQWDSMDFAQRRDALVSQAVSRYYGSMIGQDMADSEMKRTETEASIIGEDPIAALAAADDPVRLSQLWQARLFGQTNDYTAEASAAQLNKEDGRWRR